MLSDYRYFTEGAGDKLPVILLRTRCLENTTRSRLRFPDLEAGWWLLSE